MTLVHDLTLGGDDTGAECFLRLPLIDTQQGSDVLQDPSV